MVPAAREELIEAARGVVDAASGMTFSSGALRSFTRGLDELRDALAGPVSTERGLAAVVAAARRVIGGASTDDLIKARRGGAFVGSLRKLRYAVRQLDA